MNCYNCSVLGGDRLCRSCYIERRNFSVVASVIAIIAVCVLVQFKNGGTPPEIEDDQAEVTP